MPMPEAPVHKDDLLPTRENQVWSTRKMPALKPISKPKRGHETANSHFWRRVSPADASHSLATLFWRERIHDSGLKPHYPPHMKLRGCVFNHVSGSILAVSSYCTDKYRRKCFGCFAAEGTFVERHQDVLPR